MIIIAGDSAVTPPPPPPLEKSLPSLLKQPLLIFVKGYLHYGQTKCNLVTCTEVSSLIFLQQKNTHNSIIH